MKLNVPELSLVVLVGTSGSGKSTFAKKHFKFTEVLSSDYCRGLVSDDENDQKATGDAFEVLHFIASKRLASGKLTVVDATNVQQEARKPLVALAREYHVIPTAIVLNLPEKLCQERNKSRSDRNFGQHVIRQQKQQLRRSLRSLKREGFRHIHVLSSEEDIEGAEIDRQQLWNNRKFEHGPFDIIGDIHGCFDELMELVVELGYQPNGDGIYEHKENRKLVFLGDLVDRGPKTPEVVQFVKQMVEAEKALCVPGNHDIKFMRKMKGKNVQIIHGLGATLEQFEAYDKEHEGYSKIAAEFMDSLVSHYVLDDGNLVVAHAGMKEAFQGRGSGKVREFALYGETTGETDEFGLPVRYNWAAEYRGQAMVVYGHTPVPDPEWLNRTICIDTGCVFGGKLTALRYPEREFVSVPAKQTYSQAARPFLEEDQKAPALNSQQEHDDLLDLSDVTGKRFISTRLQHNVTIRGEKSIAALEVMSRFAANPKWIIYLPPTMSASETSQKDNYLEYPEEAFAYYRERGIPKIVCEEKHMGSRAILIVCRDEEVAKKRFGVIGEGIGVCYTRTGRQFFDNRELETKMLEYVNQALTKSGFWDDFNTDWVCLDCELMPWSAKAQELLRVQYAAVGCASKASFSLTLDTLRQTKERRPEIESLLKRYEDKADLAAKFVEAYGRYCWTTKSMKDYKLAPFHILATEGHVHVDKNHIWHMENIAKVCEAAESILLATPFKEIDLTVNSNQTEGIKWWEELTAKGGEGMVIKPLEFIAIGKRGLLQPALKCRGQEYLRIIYGPEYTLQENLQRLRQRGLSSKRSLALREFALGVEALERFVRREPLRRVHECIFGVLALESEPVDPRL
ncbi:MAG: polynucleotide kinase-phosphatase [Verrucomicrobiota bacterium]